ncbi:Helix-turn-helix domain-containing protein [Flavobacterium pectinovorum]|uniref:Helix-turn-helix domain-containing protein n=1 Tax=Flavobacterium pectinovorum TaxID=29533 RepID=A0AB36P477_9FLAO|nr:helix-turn-helix domain-containing protein [Flavobacterium pectinovorum]OXB05685.1 histidine kinase [Flavobacterium pectinovorum]SHM06475.1 Helix-turn-helix domain-containing protein [Flavobacterium pectinovorum]
MRLIISFLLFLVLNTSFAQQKKELTEQEYLLLQDKIRLNANVNVDSAFVYANKMAQSNNNKHLAFANGSLSYLLQAKNNTLKSKEKYLLAFKYLDKMPDSNDKIRLKSYLYNYGGLIEYKRGNFSQALENYQQGMKLSIQLDDIIQIVKFKGNIALLNEAVGNYQLAIKNLRQLDNVVDQNENLYTKEQYNTIKSNNNITLGGSYESSYMKDQNRNNKKYLLDSAEYFYKKTISYSQNIPFNKIAAKTSLGNIYSFKKDFKSAEKTYYDIIFIAKQNNIDRGITIANYNLGNLYYETKKYDKALVFLKRVDSISQANDSKDESFLKANYYLAKIYNIKKEPELAYKYSKIYLDNYEKSEAKLNNEALEVNYKLGTGDLSDEMVGIQEKFENEVLLNKALRVFYVLLVIGIVFLLIKNIRDKNKAHKKMNALIEEFKANLEKKENQIIAQNEEPEPEIEDVLFKKENVNLSIDEAKENKIVEKLLALENKLEYLNPDFTLSYVAKKIKTNTTYLSYVVNKRFGKSFGEYSNELKINYVINEMISNHMYRKYSTQAIAESVGFKNAVSFAKSFRKRTGVSPAQFANNI